MRTTASILHLDLDAFFAAVEQRDKPSLRGKPVIVGGVGMRGVVSTASYEARQFGVHSAMPVHLARRLCPHAAYLAGRFKPYRKASQQVMDILRGLSPLVEAMSIDEAYVDLSVTADGSVPDLSEEALLALAERVRAEVSERTGGLTASIGLGSSKFIAKISSELAKPDGVLLIPPGGEQQAIAGLSARAIPGVGPATMERLNRLRIQTVADIQAQSLDELVRVLGKAAGEQLFWLVRAKDEREVVPVREAKSISIEDTFEHDITERDELERIATRHSHWVARRLEKTGLFARTVTLKLRWPDYSFTSRSRTVDTAISSAEQLTRIALSLLDGVEISGGVRLLGVGVSSFTDVAQEPLFVLESETKARVVEQIEMPQRRPAIWLPGVDVLHDEYGPGWVWGAGLGRVTVRFETAETGPGPVRTFQVGDSALHLV